MAARGREAPLLLPLCQLSAIQTARDESPQSAGRGAMELTGLPPETRCRSLQKSTFERSGEA